MVCNVPSMSALVVSEMGSAPRYGKAWVLRVAHHCWPCLGLRQPSYSCSTTFAAASKVGVRWTERLSASGSPPSSELAVGDGLVSGLGVRGGGRERGVTGPICGCRTAGRGGRVPDRHSASPVGRCGRRRATASGRGVGREACHIGVGSGSQRPRAVAEPAGGHPLNPAAGALMVDRRTVMVAARAATAGDGADANVDRAGIGH